MTDMWQNIEAMKKRISDLVESDASLTRTENNLRTISENTKILTEQLKRCESALASMVNQYCRIYDSGKGEYSHDFMSAGEEAFEYLVNKGLAEYCGNGVDIRFVKAPEVEE
jgi:hypothetical protein